MNLLKRNLDKSEYYWNKAQQLIPAGTQCLSKGPTQFVNGVAPKYVVRGEGCYTWDVDGNKYIDCGMGLHPVILGYHYPAVDQAIKKQLDDGITFTLMHPYEVELSELLCEIIPCAEMVRFGKNGSDVTSCAVRLARAYTGRDMIACCGYHGWQDWYVATTERNIGVPDSVKELTKTFGYNDLGSLEKLFDHYPGKIAAVIMEAVSVEAPQDDFLAEVKKLVHKNSALLIFDEVVTGCRFALGGAQELFGVTPDLATFGKAMANGMPLSAIVGKREFMQLLEEVFFSFTFGGEVLSLAASIATINEIREKNVLDFVWRQGDKLQQGYNALAKTYGLETVTECVGYHPRTIVDFRGKTPQDSLILKSIFQQEMIKRGVLFTAYNALSYSHKDKEIDLILNATDESMKILKKALESQQPQDMLEGEPVSDVFRQT